MTNHILHLCFCAVGVLNTDDRWGEKGLQIIFILFAVSLCLWMILCPAVGGVLKEMTCPRFSPFGILFFFSLVSASFRYKAEKMQFAVWRSWLLYKQVYMIKKRGNVSVHNCYKAWELISVCFMFKVIILKNIFTWKEIGDQ